MADKNYEVKIKASGGDQAAGEFRKVDSAASGTKAKLSTVTGDFGGSGIEALAGKAAVAGAAIAGLAASLSGVTSFLKASATAAFESEAATVKLTQALANTGQEGGPGIEELATQFEKLTNVSDEAFTRAAATLIQFGARVEEMPTLFPILEGLAGRMGGDVEQAAQLLGRAIAGNTRGLAQFGVAVAEGASKTEILKAVTDAAAKGAGALAAQANTTAGRIENLSNAYARLQEEVGKQITAGGNLANTANFISAALDAIATNADKIVPALKAAFVVATPLLQPVIALLKVMNVDLSTSNSKVREVQKAFEDLKPQPVDNAAASAKALADQLSAAEKSAGALRTALDGLDDAELGNKLEGINAKEASGELTKEAAQKQRSSARGEATRRKLEREAAAIDQAAANDAAAREALSGQRPSLRGASPSPEAIAEATKKNQEIDKQIKEIDARQNVREIERRRIAAQRGASLQGETNEQREAGREGREAQAKTLGEAMARAEEQRASAKALFDRRSLEVTASQTPRDDGRGVASDAAANAAKEALQKLEAAKQSQEATAQGIDSFAASSVATDSALAAKLTALEAQQQTLANQIANLRAYRD